MIHFAATLQAAELGALPAVARHPPIERRAARIGIPYGGRQGDRRNRCRVTPGQGRRRRSGIAKNVPFLTSQLWLMPESGIPGYFDSDRRRVARGSGQFNLNPYNPLN
jgi:hypothetical protein